MQQLVVLHPPACGASFLPHLAERAIPIPSAAAATLQTAATTPTRALPRWRACPSAACRPAPALVSPSAVPDYSACSAVGWPCASCSMGHLPGYVLLLMH